MNKIIKILIKELLFYWLVASIILFFICIVVENININGIIYLTNYIYLTLSGISIIVSKIIYENYIAKFYSNYKKVDKNNLMYDLK